MAEFHIIEPKAKSFATTIALPMHRRFYIPAAADIYQCEGYFSSLVKACTDYAKKRDLDRCRATIKWAYTCNASLEKVTNSADDYGKTVEFTFAFASLENLNEFVNNLRANVSDAMM